MDGKTTVCASCDEPVLGIGNTVAIYGMQRGDKIVLGTLLAMLLLAVELRFCLHRRVWPWMLYVGGGMLLLTLLNIWNAHWIW